MWLGRCACAWLMTAGSHISTFLHNGVDPILVVQAASNGKGADADAGADAHLNQEQ
eukprot:COSAG01_NODE_841_length_13175_cov_26.426124_12_plen_56_part_00